MTIMKWIDIKEKQPEENQTFWAMEKNHEGPILMHFFYHKDSDDWGRVFAPLYEVPWYTKGKWNCNSEWDDNYEVTHWMPLPEPIQET